MCDYSLHAVAFAPRPGGRDAGDDDLPRHLDPRLCVRKAIRPSRSACFRAQSSPSRKRSNTTTAGSGPGRSTLVWASFGKIDPDIHDRHHDAIEFPDGNYVLVTQLCEGQRVSVLQLPVTQTCEPACAD